MTANLNLALCSEFNLRRCYNTDSCWCFFKRKKKKKDPLSLDECVEVDQDPSIRHTSSHITILNAPRVHIHLSAEQAKQCDYYVFDTNLKYLIIQGEHIHTKFMRPSKIIGKSVHECNLPPSIATFLEGFYKDTIRGHYLCTQMFYNSNVFLINTFPIKDDEGHILGGMLTCCPSEPNFHDVRTFRLDRSRSSSVVTDNSS